MTFASPDIAYTTHPTDALFSAHFKSSVLMAVYLIGGAAITTAALVGVGYSKQLTGTWALLPYGLMAVMLLWFGMGAWVMKRQQQQVQRCDRRYTAYMNRQRKAPASSAAELPSDEPWELRAFWAQLGADTSAPAATAQRSASTTLPTNSASYAQAQPHSAAATMEVTLMASMTEHKPLRPISLFGSVQ